MAYSTTFLRPACAALTLLLLGWLPACRLAGTDSDGTPERRDGWYGYVGAVHGTVDGAFDGDEDEPDFEPDTGVGLALGRTFGRLSLEVFVESTTFADVENPGFEIEEAELEHVGSRARIALGPDDGWGRWNPFVHLGLAKSKLTLRDGPGDDIAFPDMEFDGIAAELGLGCEVWLSHRLAARLGWVRRWLDVEEDADDPDLAAGGHEVLLGLVLRF